MIKSGGVDPKALMKLLYEWEEVDKETAQKIFNVHRTQKLDIVQACIDGGIRQDAVLGALARLLGMEMVQLGGIVLPRALIDMVKSSTARNYRIIPVRLDGKTLVVATSDPDNLAALDDLKFELAVEQVKPALAAEESIIAALDQYYPIDSADAARELVDALDIDVLRATAGH